MTGRLSTNFLWRAAVGMEDSLSGESGGSKSDLEKL